MHQATIGFHTQVSATDRFVHDGKTWEFTGWSDGGSRLHEITVPAEDSTLTAEYREAPLDVLFVVGSTLLNAGDQAVKQQLEASGAAVELADDGLVTAADADGKTAVLISSTVAPATVGAKFRSSPVPMVVWESSLFDDLGMTASTSGSFGTYGNQRTLAIQNAAHPRRAQRHPHRHDANSHFDWGRPAPAAVKVASLATVPTASTIFAYESGAAMQGVSAPARRVGFFLHDLTGASLNADGKKLPDAAVDWAEGP